MRTGFSGLLIALASLLSTGCGGQAANVSGTVTLDDQRLSSGTVAFHPEQPGPIAFGQIGSSGGYELSTGTEEGLQPGSYTVTVEATELAPATASNAEPMPKLLTPKKYQDKKTSGLVAEVKAGGNDIPLKLQSK
jgi:hypothetical protein